ncbi:MAG: hypothetical protein ACRD3F_08800 [Acidobacteriaceae bacterium]
MKPINERDLEPTGELATGIHDFRAAVTHVAERETARPLAIDWLAPARKRRRSHQHRLVLGWACAAALCFATVQLTMMPISIHVSPAPAHIAQQAPAPLVQTTEPESNSGLMEQIDDDVSESVPSSLAPLAELGSSDTASTSGDSPFAGTVLAQPGSPNGH